MKPQTASYIEMTAADEQVEALSNFLADAAPMVKKTEPKTKLWFALRNLNTLAIFDVFADKAGREAHFAGAVAQALKDKADTLVEGGWERGVVANIKNANVLSEKAAIELHTATTATYISLKAAPGKEAALAELLTAAGPIVGDTEPKTLYWTALKIDKENFAIFDIFADGSGREAHFAGQVAALLKAKSADLLVGGWDEGVVANIKNYDILAIK
ncbi:MAG: hypothetical protein AAF542_06790 [Pseudomonadota bacterium]